MSIGHWESVAFPRDKMCWAWCLRLWRNKITGLGTKYYSTWPNRACYQILSTGCLPGQRTKKRRVWDRGNYLEAVIQHLRPMWGSYGTKSLLLQSVLKCPLLLFLGICCLIRIILLKFKNRNKEDNRNKGIRFSKQKRSPAVLFSISHWEGTPCSWINKGVQEGLPFQMAFLPGKGREALNM